MPMYIFNVRVFISSIFLLLLCRVSYLEERLAGHTVLEAQVESLSRQVDNVFNELDQLHVSRVPQKETKLKHVHSPLRDNEESPVPLKLLMEKQRWDKNKKLLSQMGLSEVCVNKSYFVEVFCNYNETEK